MNCFDIIYQLPERPVYFYCSISFTLRAKRFLLAWLLVASPQTSFGVRLSRNRDKRTPKDVCGEARLLAFVKSFAWRISRVEWNHLNCPGKPKDYNPYNIEIRQLIFISNSRLIIDENTRMFFTFPFILLHLPASSRRSDWITGMLAQRNVSRKKQRGGGDCRIEGALFPIRSPFQATHHYLHSIVEQANVLPLCIRERNKQQRRRRLRTRPGGTPVFKWQGWSKRGKNQNPNKFLRLPKKILT